MASLGQSRNQQCFLCYQTVLAHAVLSLCILRRGCPWGWALQTPWFLLHPDYVWVRQGHFLFLGLARCRTGNQSRANQLLCHRCYRLNSSFTCMFIQELWLHTVAAGLQKHARAIGRSLTAGPLLPMTVTHPSNTFLGIGLFLACGFRVE